MHKYFYENEKRIITACLLENITSIRVEFDGSGDSGQIEDVSFVQGPQDYGYQPKGAVTVFRPGPREFNQDTQRWEHGEFEGVQLSLHDAVFQHVDDALDDVSVDWYNNDGGFGHWEWDTTTGIEFEVYQRIVEETLGHSENRPVGATEEDV